MSPAGFPLPKLLDGEEIWKLWHGVGYETDVSLAQIYNKFKVEGRVNPKTGVPVTRAGMCFSAWRWAFDNLEIAIEQWIAAWESHGEVYTREDALRIFVKRAKSAYRTTKHNFSKFIEKYNLQEYI